MAIVGQIVLFKFPQTDLKIGKLRPALLIKPLSNDYDDWLVCMISTKIGQEVTGLDEIILILQTHNNPNVCVEPDNQGHNYQHLVDIQLL